MPATTVRQKILLIFAGLCLGLLAGEGFFRLGGFIVSSQQSAGSGENGAVQTILCVGDSSTYGIGASDVETFSYPAQLQRLLDATAGRFRVINIGIPGINSSQVLNRLQDNIVRFKPDLIVMMIGINDPWNLEESSRATHPGMSATTVLVKRVELLLARVRLFEFLKLAWVSREWPRARIPEFDDLAIHKAVEFYGGDTGRQEALDREIGGNIERLSQIAHENRVGILFMKYHDAGWGHAEIAIHQAYRTLPDPIADCETPFREAEKLGLETRGSDGWHPNDLGYLLMAKTVYNQLVLLGLVQGTPVRIL